MQTSTLNQSRTVKTISIKQTAIAFFSSCMLALSLVSAPAQAHHKGHGKHVQHGPGTHYEYGQVLRAKPIYETHRTSVPRQSCWQEQVTHRSRSNSSTGTIVGGIIGAAVGHELGHKKRNKQIGAVAGAVHDVGGLFVLDCVASGTMWIDMDALGVDVLLSAPQKGWSASPCSGLVMLSKTARERIDETEAASYVCDLKKWLAIMETYENGGHAYHATMPTDALLTFRDTLLETEAYGFDKVREEQIALGTEIRALLESRGIKSVAAKGFQAPSVVVSYTDDDEIKNGKKFAEVGVQIAAGVPLQCGEGADFKTFRIGLFGLDKLHDCARSVANFKAALDKVIPAS